MRYINHIGGRQVPACEGGWIDKFDPHTGQLQASVTSSQVPDVTAAFDAAEAALASWSSTPAVVRGEILTRVVDALQSKADPLARMVAAETGKPLRDAVGEVGGAIAQGRYFAGEGMRLHGRSLTSAVAGKSSYTVRQHRGIAGLIVPANTPIANIAWKVFPALICGNTAVLKAAEDAPGTADLFMTIAREAGLPNGVLNCVQGGAGAGRAVVEEPRAAIISFTGSTGVGRWIAETAGRRLVRVSLELGGKNPFVVCDDADLDQAVHWAALSAFSNAGQRCAAGSRILIFSAVYEAFRDALVAHARKLSLGVQDGCDLGPVVNLRQHQSILKAIEGARGEGGSVLCGGGPPDDEALSGGYYIAPTIIEGLFPTSSAAQKELFGPVATMHRVADIHEALAIANGTEYGLTAAIHTRNVDRATWFVQRVRAGVANVNLGTYGSEPHMPFGGFGASGNGTREPGVEALDVYSELKNISILTRDSLL